MTQNSADSGANLRSARWFRKNDLPGFVDRPEALGLALSGSSLVPSTDERRGQFARQVGRRAVEAACRFMPKPWQKKVQRPDSEGQIGTEPESALPTISSSQCPDSNIQKELP
ncbi:dihydroxy-acid dehydratase [Variovorax paradoxus]|nr:dihydroxy-acid dehydratase [Variovorax paradoxus]